MGGQSKIAIVRLPVERDPLLRGYCVDDHYLGALSCLRDHPSWDVVALGLPLAPVQTFREIEDLRRDEIAGVIVEGGPERMIERCRDQRIPVVAMDRYRDGSAVPTVYSDDVAIGKMAAQYFLRRGFRSLAFSCGWYVNLGRPLRSVRRRLQGLTDAAQASGASCEMFVMQDTAKVLESGEASEANMELYFGNLREWLRRLPRPVGILAYADIWAMDCLEACREEGLRVPQDVAIMGVDNDTFRCEASRPSLTSIDRNRYRIGYEAAALLVRFLETGRWGDVPVMVPPAGVVERLSTETLAVKDARVADALRFVRERFCDPISARDVARSVGVSEHWLRQAFRRELGFALVSEIRRLRVEKACDLLAGNDLSLQTIAEAVGFRRENYLCNVFARDVGVSPRVWRLTHHRHGVPRAVR